jgi:hypothetical protein
MMALEEGDALVEEADRVRPLASARPSGGPAKLRTLDLRLHAIEVVTCPRAAPGKVPNLELQELQRHGAERRLVDDEAGDDERRLDGGRGVRQQARVARLVQVTELHQALNTTTATRKGGRRICRLAGASSASDELLPTE